MGVIAGPPACHPEQSEGPGFWLPSALLSRASQHPAPHFRAIGVAQTCPLKFPGLGTKVTGSNLAGPSPNRKEEAQAGV